MQDRSEDRSQVLLEEIPASTRPDLLRRFTATPHSLDLRVISRTLRLETNNSALLDLALKFFQRHQHGEPGAPEFLWRIVCEPDPRAQTTDLALSAFSDPGLRYVSFGQRSFLSVDIENREAAGFLSNVFVDDVEKFNSRPLDILFCMTAPSLGLTAMSGGCVGLKDRGVMVFGPPNSGKTTACYLASKMGMEFHADQGIFLDSRGEHLSVWGDLFPAVFRPQALEFLPELRQSVRPSSHVGFPFLYLDKAPMQTNWAHSVTPVATLFLVRQETAEKPELKVLSKEDALSKLRASLLFAEDTMFEVQVTHALNALASKPAYSLKYANDPGVASRFIEKILR